MNDFKRNDRFGGKRTGGGFGRKGFGRPAFGAKPGFQRSGGGFNRSQGQMYPAICANCGKETEVPFRPAANRPVYCRDCFGTTNQPSALARSVQAAREYPKRQSPAPQSTPAKPAAPDPRIESIQQQLVKMQAKLDLILLEMAVVKAQKPWEQKTPAKHAEAPAPKKTPAKKIKPAKKK